MTRTAGRTPARRLSAVIGLGASVLAVTASLAPGVGASAGPASPPTAAAHSVGPARTTTVMTRNLYLGADLTPVLTALASGDPTAVVGAATQTWAAVRATRPEERMAAIADEIVAADPDLVGLQEVTTWTTYSLSPEGAPIDPVVAYDFLDLLLDELAERGVDYSEVEGATAHNFASPPIPILADAPVPTTQSRTPQSSSPTATSSSPGTASGSPTPGRARTRTS